jgi:ribosomal-protein-serine acetyltransferase
MLQTATLCIQIDDAIQLRLLELRYAEEAYSLALHNKKHLAQWMEWAASSNTLEDMRAFIKYRLLQFANAEALQLGIWYDGQLVGFIGFNTIQYSNRKADIGYWLAEDAQGKGIITRACQALITYGFHEYGLNKIEIRCAEGNVRSRAIPTRLGFTQEGIIRQNEILHDHYVDHVLYGLLASEWGGGLQKPALGKN